MFADRKSCSRDLARREVGGEQPQHGELGLARRFEDGTGARALARQRELTLDLRDEPGRTPASGSSTSASRARRRASAASIQASATGAHPGDQREQPRVMDGRHLVAEEVLGGGELALGLRELPLRREHDAHRGGDVRAEPAPTRSEAPDGFLRLLGVSASRGQPLFPDGHQRERRVRMDQARYAAADVRMLQHAECDGSCLVQVAGEVERTGVRHTERP